MFAFEKSGHVFPTVKLITSAQEVGDIAARLSLYLEETERNCSQCILITCKSVTSQPVFD